MANLRTKEPRVDPLDVLHARRNLRVLLRYGALMLGVVILYSVLFRLIMGMAEGQTWDWFTGIYWTISTMTTLGLGDIVFESTIGRVFTVVVLVTGILMLFIILPFAFIQLFFAPWVESRRVAVNQTGHVIITHYDNIAPALAERLASNGMPYYIIEPDPGRATALSGDGVSVVTGQPDDRTLYDRLRVHDAGMVVANGPDTVNTNVTLTVRDASPTVPITSLITNPASADILALAGSTHVMPLKQQLGAHLANRINAGHGQTHVIGRLGDLVIAEFAVHNTPFSGQTLRDARLREETGVNVIGILEKATFRHPTPDTTLASSCVPVVIGTSEQMDRLDDILAIYDTNPNPVLVVGGGVVGRAAAHTLKSKGVPVHMIEREAALTGTIGDVPERLFVGDAAELDIITGAGLLDAPAVLLTTSDDAMNIYLAVYCRKLAPEIRIVSRINHDRNMDAIRRAGADFALSHTAIGVESVFAALRGYELVLLGERVGFHHVPVPPSLAGQTLAAAAIATLTDMNVIAIHQDGHYTPASGASTPLTAGTEVVMVGSSAGREAFQRHFG